MYSKPVLALKYCQYLFRASNSRGHGIHSPFLFEFIDKVLNDDRSFHAFQDIEQERKAFLKNKTQLTIEDFGAGSAILKTKERTVASIAATSLKPRKYSQLFFRMIDHYGFQQILEIGTSLGITSAYLAAANPKARVVTLEGSVAIANQASQLFKQLDITNIQLITGNFDDTLQGAVDSFNRIDFAFIDGNHRYAPTIAYFTKLLEKSGSNTVIILDDIHWSGEMEAAWNWVKDQELVTMTIDLFFVGIVLLKKEFHTKQHFAIRY